MSLSSLWERLGSGIFAKGAIYYILASAALNVTNFLFHVVVSRIIGPTAYGGLGAVLGLIALLTVPISALQIAVTQAVSAQQSTDGHSLHILVRRSIIAGVAGCFGTIALFPVLDSFLHFNSPTPIVLTGLWIPFAVLAAVLQGSLIGEYRFTSVAVASFVGGGIVRLVLGVIFALLGYGVAGAIVATLGAQVVTTVWLVVSTRHQTRRNLAVESISTARTDVAYSVSVLAGLSALTGVDTFLARHFLIANVAGQYAAGAIAAHIALFVPTAVVTITFPRFSDRSDSPHNRRRAFNQALQFVIVLGGLTTVLMVAVPKLLTKVLFGSDYGGASAVVRPLAIESLLLGVLTLVVYLYLSRRQAWSLIPWFGVVAAVVAIAIHHVSSQELADVMTIVVAVTSILSIIHLRSALNFTTLSEDIDK